jgi:hypothetical protein
MVNSTRADRDGTGVTPRVLVHPRGLKALGFIAGLLILAAAVAGCAQPSASQQPPPRGISKAQAVAIGIKAEQGYSATPLKLVSAVADHLTHSTATGPNSQWVWDMVFNGTYPSSSSCGPPPPAGEPQQCPTQYGPVSVTVSYSTGKILAMEVRGAPA